MKKLIHICLFLLTIKCVNAQSSVIKINLMGKVYTVSEKIPPELIGEYLYEQKGEPKVLLNKDRSGYFQRHGMEPTPIKYWIDCDENGILRKQTGDNGKYKYTLLIKTLDGTEMGRLTGGYDLMDVMIVPESNYVVFLGERYKTLN